MIFGYQLTMWFIIIAGAVVGTIFMFSMLVGLRIIRFKGRRHLRVHKTLAWIALGLAAVHGFAALTFLFGWRILS